MKKRWILFPVLLAAAGFAAYHNSFQGQFVFDEISCIVQNPGLAHPWPFHPAWFAEHLEAFIHRPLLRFSLALNYACGGLDVWGYHAFNLAVHVAAACLLFGFLSRTFQTKAVRLYDGTSANRLAFAIALIWVVHPLTTQSVTYVLQRAESLMGLFYLLTLYALVRCSSSSRPSLWKNISAVSCVLGMSTKQVMVTAPLMALLYDRIFLTSSWREVWRSRGGLHAALMGTWLVLLLWFWTDPRIVSAGLQMPTLSFWQNLATQCAVLAHYLRLSFWSHPLVFDYAWTPAKHLLDLTPAGLWVPLGLACTLWALRNRPALGFLGIWFFLIQAPTVLIPMPREVAAEQRMYLPLMAVITAAAGAASRFIPQRWRPVLLAAVVLPLALKTSARNHLYQDPVRLWQDTALHQPGSPYAHFNLGVVLMREQRFPESAEAFRRATEVAPDFPDAYWNWGYALEMQGRRAPADAFRAVSLFQRGNHPAAAARFRQALSITPQDPLVHLILGVTLARANQWEEAIAHFREALRLDPGNGQARKNLETALKLEEQGSPR